MKKLIIIFLIIILVGTLVYQIDQNGEYHRHQKQLDKK